MNRRKPFGSKVKLQWKIIYCGDLVIHRFIVSSFVMLFRTLKNMKILSSRKCETILICQRRVCHLEKSVIRFNIPCRNRKGIIFWTKSNQNKLWAFFDFSCILYVLSVLLSLTLNILAGGHKNTIFYSSKGLHKWQKLFNVKWKAGLFYLLRVGGLWKPAVRTLSKPLSAI